MAEELFSDEFYKKHSVDPSLDYQKAIFLGQQIVDHIKETKGAIFGLPLLKFQIDKIKDLQRLENLVHTQEFFYRELIGETPPPKDTFKTTIFKSVYTPLPDRFYDGRVIRSTDYYKAKYLATQLLAQKPAEIDQCLEALIKTPEKLESLVRGLEIVYQAFKEERQEE